MEDFVVGIDGGGTKTCINIRNLNNETIDSKTFGPLNINSISREEFVNTCKNIIDFIAPNSKKIEKCKMIVIGTAGITNKDTIEILNESFKQFLVKKKIIVKGDFEIALFGALEKEEGAILISGTGSIAYGKNNNKELRCGGYGHLIDDEGSAYAIGRDILKAIIRSHDFRQEKTLLKDLVFDFLRINKIEDLIKFVYNKKTSKKDIAKLSVLIEEACIKNDYTAKKIINNSVNELYLLIKTVIENLCLEKKEISFLGSVLLKNNNISNSLKKLIFENFKQIKIIDLKNDPSIGASKLALKYYFEE